LLGDLGLPLFKSAPHACPYLPRRMASELVAFPHGVDSVAYQMLMNRGFRRSGAIFYKPDCPRCRSCVPIRVPVASFGPSRSQRRALARNRDVSLRVHEPVCDRARYELFIRYDRFKHDGQTCVGFDEFEAHFCFSPIDTIEMDYYLGDSLVGVGLVDVCPDGLSSVYFYFEPDQARRSLGIYSALCEIDLCRSRGLAHWYVGFVVDGCPKMSYKSAFRPHELMRPDGRWIPGDAPGATEPEAMHNADNRLS